MIWVGGRERCNLGFGWEGEGEDICDLGGCKGEGVIWVGR